MEQLNQQTAPEMAMHIALCVCSEYIQSWGMSEFLGKLEEYSSDPCLPFVKSYTEKLEEKL